MKNSFGSRENMEQELQDTKTANLVNRNRVPNVFNKHIISNLLCAETIITYSRTVKTKPILRKEKNI